MKESYSDDIMLCFVQGFGNRGDPKKCDNTETEDQETDNIQNKKIDRKLSQGDSTAEENDLVELRSTLKSRALVTGKSLRLSSGEKYMKRQPDVKRSFSDRFSVVNDGAGKRPKKLLTIRKTWSTGNFATGAAGGGGGAPRSAPATPLQLEPPHRHAKHDKGDKQVVKPLSSSTPSVRVAALSNNNAGAVSDASEGKAPSKARQKKFFRHFPQVGPEEWVLNYYSCALVGDILLQGHLYITKNYFAFYSNVFGYVTKLLIPTSSVQRVTKEKMARIIPNAVGVCTCDERHVFGSLLSRDSTYKLMTHVWKAARAPEMAAPPPPQELRISEAELDASELSLEDETSSGGGGDATDGPRPAKRREAEAIISGRAAVIQPALLTGAASPHLARPRGGLARALLIGAALLLALCAVFLAVQVYESRYGEDELSKLSDAQLYWELVRWRARLHGRAASELQAFLTTNLLLLNKVRQSLEALSGVMLTDLSQTPTGVPRPTLPTDVPNDTAFS